MNKSKIIKKRWKMCLFDKTFDKSFQIRAINEYMRNLLFKQEECEIERNSIKNDEIRDINMQVEGIIEEALSLIAKIAVSIKKPRESILKGLARKMCFLALACISLHFLQALNNHFIFFYIL